MSRTVAAFVTACLLLGSATLLSACNTVSGAGQDVSAVGNAVTRGADRAKP
ncbi:MAG: hypothetical protein DI601_01120 [Azospirillum brasilense]|nr:MAG: hypothetical protein DI601_01120 [Azospirillum brasilense]